MFPALSKTRSVNRCFRDAKKPGMLVYEEANTAADWSSAKIRLGWLIQAALKQQPLLHDKPMAEQMRAFEAELFMIGYDVICINENVEFSTAQSKSHEKVPCCSHIAF